MISLILHDFHQHRGAQFTSVNDSEIVQGYGDVLAEHQALTTTAGLLDLTFRSRLCLTGADRIRFLHGQVTNDVSGLAAGQGCYAALITAKGKMQADLNIYRLEEELLVDMEPGLAQPISERLEKYVISEDVQVVDVAGVYGVLSLQGPKAQHVIAAANDFAEIPAKPFAFVKKQDAEDGEIYLMNRPRFGSSGFDLFVPAAALPELVERLAARVTKLDGRLCGVKASEIARIEAGIPRFGADMDETNIPLEAGLETSAISFKKGCYIGQEVISRIKTYGQVAKALRGLRLFGDVSILPAKGEKLYKDGKEVGYITSAVASPGSKANLALGYVRREANQIGTELTLGSDARQTRARIIAMPFQSLSE